jgi:hypothetical protein
VHLSIFFIVSFFCLLNTWICLFILHIYFLITLRGILSYLLPSYVTLVFVCLFGMYFSLHLISAIFFPLYTCIFLLISSCIFLFTHACLIIYFSRVIFCSLKKHSNLFIVQPYLPFYVTRVFFCLLNTCIAYFHLTRVFVCLLYTCSCPWLSVRINYIFRFLYATGGFIINHSYFDTLQKILCKEIKENVVSMFIVIT